MTVTLVSAQRTVYEQNFFFEMHITATPDSCANKPRLYDLYLSVSTLRYACLLIVMQICNPFKTYGDTPDYIAFLEDIHGSVAVRSSPSKSFDAARGITFLRAGAEVKTGRDGSVILSQMFAKRLDLGPSITKRIEPLPEQSRGDVLSRLDFAEAYSAYWGAQDAEKSPSRGREYLNGDLIAIYPRNDVLLEKHPAFRWSPIKAAEEYEIVLRNGLDVDDVIWKDTFRASDASQATYPQERPPLPPGIYQWEIRASEKNGLAARTDTATFTIPASEQEDIIRADLARIGSTTRKASLNSLLLISVYIKFGMFAEAEASTNAALSNTPKDEGLLKLLMEIYQAMDRADKRKDIEALLKENTRQKGS